MPNREVLKQNVPERKIREQRINEIYAEYCSCLDDSMESRRDTMFSRLQGEVFLWCTDYPFVYFSGSRGQTKVDAEEMGLEICAAVRNCAGKYAGKPFDEFFTILKQALQNAWKEYCVSYKKEYGYGPDTVEKINIKSNTKTAKKIEKLLAAKTHESGHELNEDEKLNCITGYFSISKEKAKKYLRYMNMAAAIPLDSLDLPDTSGNPADEFMRKAIMEKFLDIPHIMERVLQKHQKKTRACYKALFTVYCIKEKIDFEGTPEFLDSEIMDTYKKTGRKPSQYEVYLEYHAGITRGSAMKLSSEMIETFLEELQCALKEKIPEFTF